MEDADGIPILSASEAVLTAADLAAEAMLADDQQQLAQEPQQETAENPEKEKNHQAYINQKVAKKRKADAMTALYEEASQGSATYVCCKDHTRTRDGVHVLIILVPFIQKFGNIWQKQFAAIQKDDEKVKAMERELGVYMINGGRIMINFAECYATPPPEAASYTGSERPQLLLNNGFRRIVEAAIRHPDPLPVSSHAGNKTKPKYARQLIAEYADATKVGVPVSQFVTNEQLVPRFIQKSAYWLQKTFADDASRWKPEYAGGVVESLAFIVETEASLDPQIIHCDLRWNLLQVLMGLGNGVVDNKVGVCATQLFERTSCKTFRDVVDKECEEEDKREGIFDCLQSCKSADDAECILDFWEGQGGVGLFVGEPKPMLTGYLSGKQGSDGGQDPLSPEQLKLITPRKKTLPAKVEQAVITVDEKTGQATLVNGDQAHMTPGDRVMFEGDLEHCAPRPGEGYRTALFATISRTGRFEDTYRTDHQYNLHNNLVYLLARPSEYFASVEFHSHLEDMLLWACGLLYKFVAYQSFPSGLEDHLVDEKQKKLAKIVLETKTKGKHHLEKFVLVAWTVKTPTKAYPTVWADI